ncbi:hypothetical protein BDZ45DRAFT_683537 [Acephala macrosclerotiorum]|nr:hypothetical protein BDZ45DRAFT_683537 [Acephala macrosclerotiorum]
MFGAKEVISRLTTGPPGWRSGSPRRYENIRASRRRTKTTESREHPSWSPNCIPRNPIFLRKLHLFYPSMDMSSDTPLPDLPKSSISSPVTPLILSALEHLKKYTSPITVNTVFAARTSLF